MKPDFALKLTHDSIGLLHRTSRGWLEVGSAAFDDPDLPEALGYLRRSALGLSPAGFTTKLVIPNSQILYLTVEAPGPDGASRKVQVRAALEGRTPYAVEDLVFDWWGTGPEVRTAVVARETLEEAEAFAVQYRFNPISFVAIPDDATFGGEPWFGPTAHAATLLGPDEKVERDQDPMGIVAREMPRPAADGTAATSMAAPTPVEVTDPGPAHPDPAAPAVVVPASVDPVPLVPVPTDSASSDPASAELASSDDAPAEPLVTLSKLVLSPVADVAIVDVEPAAALESTQRLGVTDLLGAEGLAAARTEPVMAEADADVRMDRAAADAASDPLIGHSPTDPAPLAVRPVPPLDGARPLPVRRFGAPVVPGDVTDPQVVEPEAAVTFASRRARSVDGSGTGPARTPLQTALAVAARDKAAAAPSGDTVPASADQQTTASATTPATRAADIVVRTQPAVQAKTISNVTDRGPRTPVERVPVADRPVAVAGSVAVVPLTTVADPRRDRPRTGTAVPDGFGSRPDRTQGKPRFLGLILTGVLLLLLAVVAAWSSFYLASGNGASPTLVSTDPGTAPEPAAAASPVASVANAGAAAPPPIAAPLVPDPPAEDPGRAGVPAGPAVAATTIAPGLRPATPSPVDDAAPAALPLPQDEIVLSSADAPPIDAATAPLPAAAAETDAIPATPLAPPPFGTVYAFDAEGQIMPTAEGIVTPEGITLFAGKPVKVPPARPVLAGASAQVPVVATAADPSRPQTRPGSAANAAIGIAAAATAPASIPDPALAGQRPRTRPAGIPVAQDGAAAAPIPADPAHAGLRPATRPIEIVAAVSARQQTEAASLAIAEAAAATPAKSDSPLAIAVSGRPAPRPGNFSKAVESAVAAAVRDAPADPVEVAVAPAAQATLRVRQPTAAEEPARIAPEDDDEPEQASAPIRSVNNRGTVAKNATFANAINLRDINLIGVYGSQSNRYALIRQANGRYKKVQVGDRIGGGVVAAITADQVRYQKGNRMYALEMPRG